MVLSGEASRRNQASQHEGHLKCPLYGYRLHHSPDSRCVLNHIEFEKCPSLMFPNNSSCVSLHPRLFYSEPSVCNRRPCLPSLGSRCFCQKFLVLSSSATQKQPISMVYDLVCCYCIARATVTTSFTSRGSSSPCRPQSGRCTRSCPPVETSSESEGRRRARLQ